MRLARIATVPLALAALAALSCSKSETSGSSNNLGSVSCSSADQSVCPPSNLSVGFNGSSGTPSITPADSRTSISVSSSDYVVTGATSSAQPGYWFAIVDGTLRAWGNVAVGTVALRAAVRNGLAATDSTTAFYAEIPLFCGQQAIVYRFDNGSGHSFWYANVTLTNCSTPVFRAQLTWDTFANDTLGSDMDLHLVQPGGTTYDAAGGTDCFYADCVGGTLTWANQDVDNTIGYGPENIVLTSTPQSGTYHVLINNYDGFAGTHATVKLYFNDVEAARWTSQTLDWPAHAWWTVADVNIQTKTITPILTYSDTVPTSPAIRARMASIRKPR